MVGAHGSTTPNPFLVRRRIGRGSILPPVLSPRRMVAHESGVDLETEARAFREPEHRFLDKLRLAHCHIFDDALDVPQAALAAVEIGNRGGEVNGSKRPHLRPDVVQSHRYSIQLRVLGNSPAAGESARKGDIRMDDIYRHIIDKWLELFYHFNFLAG